MAQREPTRSLPAPVATTSPEIPDKLYFRIGEVARLCSVPAYVLRFWESEFTALRPHKGGTGQRLYRRRDVETALHIKHLLYDEGYTIPGARQILKSEARNPEPQLVLAIAPAPHADLRRHLKTLKADLLDLHTLLARSGSDPDPRPSRQPRLRPALAPPRVSSAANLFPSTASLAPEATSVPHPEIL